MQDYLSKLFDSLARKASPAPLLPERLKKLPELSYSLFQPSDPVLQYQRKASVIISITYPVQKNKIS
ncbi:MAG: hypothetical protein C0408_11265 [Odoribacter sp.]|nr:hypothetical protein [Odoribacter sp.]